MRFKAVGPINSVDLYLQAISTLLILRFSQLQPLQCPRFIGRVARLSILTLRCCRMRVGDEGLEPVPSSPQETPFSQQGGAESGALSGDDERPQLLIERWPTLSKAVQQQIMLLVG